MVLSSGNFAFAFGWFKSPEDIRTLLDRSHNKTCNSAGACVYFNIIYKVYSIILSIGSYFVKNYSGDWGYLTRAIAVKAVSGMC